MIRISLAALLAALPALAAAQDPVPAERITSLIGKFSAPDIEGREKAVAELVRIGPPALDALRRAAKEGGPEVQKLAGQAIEGIEWTGLGALKDYMGKMFADGSTVEQAKLKALAQWFPDARFYEVKEGAGAQAGPAAMMGLQQAGRNLFAVERFKKGFTRVVVKGITCRKSFGDLIRRQKIVLKGEDKALDFALAYMEVQGGASQYAVALAASMGGSGGAFERVDEGWKLDSGGSSMVFETDKDDVLTGVRSVPVSYFERLGLGGGGAPVPEAQQKLVMEKLRLEIELLKRQLNKK